MGTYEVCTGTNLCRQFLLALPDLRERRVFSFMLSWYFFIFTHFLPAESNEQQRVMNSNRIIHDWNMLMPEKLKTWIQIQSSKTFFLFLQENIPYLDYCTYPYKGTVKKFRTLQITASVLLLYFFIKAYVVGIHLNCIDLLMQFKWVPTIYAFYKENQKKKHA